MDLSKLIFQILAVIYLSVGAGFIISKDYYKKHISDLTKNFGALYIGAFTAIILGFLMLRYYNSWDMNSNIIITILGYIAIIKGIILIVFPNIMSFLKPLLNFDNIGKIIIIPIIIGLISAYLGFIAP